MFRQVLTSKSETKPCKSIYLIDVFASVEVGSTNFYRVKSDDKIFLEKLGQKIASIRKNQKLTKVQLGFEINTREAAIRRIELGQVYSGIVILRKIAIALHVSVSE